VLQFRPRGGGRWNSDSYVTSWARDVRGTVIPESGHNIALENPAALAQAYLDFFAGG
jgi:hypothetical protein